MASIYSEEYRRLLERLRGSRLAAGLTQADVARALRRPQSFVSKCESGERKIGALELVRFAALYRKPLDYFVEPPAADGASLAAEQRPPRRRAPRRRKRRGSNKRRIP